MSGTIIATNILALNAHRNLSGIGVKGAKASERLSSGMRINSAADDAAGSAISEKMKAQIRGMKQGERNVEDGISLIKTMDGGMDNIQEMMLRQRELIVQALNDTNEELDRDKIQMEIDQLTAEMAGTAEITTFNNVPLLAGQEAEVLAPVDVCFVIDVSGSMSSALQGVKNNIEIFMNKLPSNSRVGFVIYSDHLENSSSESIKTFPPSSDLTSVRNYINNVQLMGGGGYEEAGLEAIIEAINLWDGAGDVGDGRDKHIIQITDALSHTSDDSLPSWGAYTNAEINQELKSRGIVFNAALATTDTAVINQVTEIGAGTGGTISTTQNYVDWGWDEYKIMDVLGNLWIQSGANGNQGLYINRYDCRPKVLYKDIFSPNTITIEINGVRKTIELKKLVTKPWEDATASLAALDEVFGKVTSYRAKAGAQQNRLEFISKSLGVSILNLEDAHSRIADADMAKEMMNLTKYNILQQASISMLAQANQHPQTVLQLLS